ncbi:unnamed protein product, partial [Effrenium voratum]
DFGGLPTFQGPRSWHYFAGLPLEEVLCAGCFQEASDSSGLKDARLAWALWGTLLRRSTAMCLRRPSSRTSRWRTTRSGRPWAPTASLALWMACGFS